MKFIRALSSITLVSCLSVSSGAAVAKVTEQVSNPTSSAQTEPMIIANPLRKIREGVRTIDQINQIRLREQRRQEQEAAQREAAEQRRLEAERQQRYFESLSPEEQQAYLAEQQQRELEKWSIMLGITSRLFGGGTDTNQQDEKCNVEHPVGISVDGTVEYETLTPREARARGLICNR